MNYSLYNCKSCQVSCSHDYWFKGIIDCTCQSSLVIFYIETTISHPYSFLERLGILISKIFGMFLKSLPLKCLLILNRFLGKKVLMLFMVGME